MNSYSKIVEGNRYFKNTNHEFQSLVGGQHPSHVVIACSDSRVEPEKMTNAKLGQLFVVRVAGESIGENSLASVEYAVKELGVMSIIIICHTKCGAVTAAQEILRKHSEIRIEKNSALYKSVKKISRTLAKDPRNMADLRHAIIDNAWAQAEKLKRSSIVNEARKRGLKIRVAIYNIENGEIKFLHSTHKEHSRLEDYRTAVGTIPRWMMGKIHTRADKGG